MEVTRADKMSTNITTTSTDIGTKGYRKVSSIICELLTRKKKKINHTARNLLNRLKYKQ